MPIKEGLTIKDFEQAVDNAIDNLYIMYKNNGGNETEQVVKVLLKNINRISPYLETIIETVSSTEAPGDKGIMLKLSKLIEPMIDAIKEK